MTVIFRIVLFMPAVAKQEWRQQLSGVGIPVALIDTFKSLESKFCWLLYTKFRSSVTLKYYLYAETVSSWFLLKLKVLQLTWNRV